MVHRTPRIALAVLALALGAAAPAQASAPDHFTISVSPSPAKAGAPLTITAVAKDSAGATVTAYDAPGTFSDATGALPATDATFAHGVGSAVVTYAGPVHGEVVNVISGATRSSSAPFDVLGAVRSLDVRVPPRSDAGAPFTATVYARDAAGSVVTDYAGVPEWRDSAGALSATQPGAFVGGLSRTTVATTAPVRGDVLSVRTGDAAGASRAFSRIGSLDHLDVSAPSTVSQWRDFTVVARARDAAGNAVTGATGPVTWSDASGSVAPGAPSGFVAGVSTTTAHVDEPYRGDVITISAGGVTGRTRAFNVLGELSQLSVSGVPAEATVGVPFTIVVTARDRVNNVLTNRSGAPAVFASWGYGNEGGNLSEFSRGTSRTVVTLTQAATADTLMVGVDFTAGYSRRFATIGPVDRLELTWAPTATATGCRGSLVVRALDTAQNVVRSYAAAAPEIGSPDGATLDRSTGEPFVNGISATPLTVTGAHPGDQILVTAGENTWFRTAC
jgi:hypothetical protein